MWAKTTGVQHAQECDGNCDNEVAHTRSGAISIAHIEKPYGEFSSPVVSIGVSMEGDDDHVEELAAETGGA
jgi:hypothetical protein